MLSHIIYVAKGKLIQKGLCQHTYLRRSPQKNCSGLFVAKQGTELLKCVMQQLGDKMQFTSAVLMLGILKHL